MILFNFIIGGVRDKSAPTDVLSEPASAGPSGHRYTPLQDLGQAHQPLTLPAPNPPRQKRCRRIQPKSSGMEEINAPEMISV